MYKKPTTNRRGRKKEGCEESQKWKKGRRQ